MIGTNTNILVWLIMDISYKVVRSFGSPECACQSLHDRLCFGLVNF